MGATSRLAAIVVNYGTPDATQRAIRSLRESHRPVDDLIVIDNSPPHGSLPPLPALALPTTLLLTGRNLGFAGGSNVGIRAALARGADRVFLLNSDAVVEPECLPRLEAALEARPDAGIAGPVVRWASDPARVMSAGIRYSPRTGRMRHHASGTRQDDLERWEWRTVDGVGGCAMLITRAVLERVGLLGEDYFFSFEDLDLCLRARGAGFVTLCVREAGVLHEGSRSIGRRSSSRFYFAARNHLLLARRAAPANPLAGFLRAGSILGLNVAHALVSAEAPRLEGVGSVLQGVWDHLRGRYGDRPASSRLDGGAAG